MSSQVFHTTVTKLKASAKGGKGICMTVEKDGKVYTDVIDAITGAAVGALGWGDTDIQEAMAEAAKHHTYSYPGCIVSGAAEKLSKFYIDQCPKGVFRSALWTCSGSESNENALKIVRQYQLERGRPEKLKIISREASYHGFTLGAMSIGGGPRGVPFEDIMIDQKNVCLKMPMFYPYRRMKDGETVEQYAQRLLDSLEKLIIENDPNTVSMVIVESMSGSSIGTPVPPKNYLKGIRDICNKYDLIFMVDEVMCGTGRINDGKLCCWENFLAPEDAPDIQTVGKTLGSGYVTIAGVLVGPKIYNAFAEGSGVIVGAQTYHSHDFNCRVALAVQQKILKQNLTANVFKMGNLMGGKLQKALADSKIVGDVRGLGGFWSLEFVKDKSTKETFQPSLKIGSRFADVALEHKVNLMGLTGGNTTGKTWDIAVLGPSFIITEKDVEILCERIVEAVKDFTKTLETEGIV
ncbi:related to ornithine aminotransferase [Zygosaccharomyces bailii ISA1307]|nr:related to ornithine aminotransferase [Zygosaccharomyces bailii ISA1307]